MCWFLTSFYLESWFDFAMDPTNEHHSGKKVWAVHGKSELTETEKRRAGAEQNQERAYQLLHQGDCSQRTCPGRPNSHFGILLWHFTALALKCAKISHRTLWTKKLVVASIQHAISLFQLTNQPTPWPSSASELYQLSDRRLSAKLVLTFEDREVSHGQCGGSPTNVISIF
jgi:hypothetical protein